ncbi:MAG: diphthine--ammonia ligase [Fibrobacter sp.]|nr:diphthine--ammonia ligase [Fibrobacter sp.]
MNTCNDKSSAFQFFCSWSGGKDSCLALFRMLNAGNVCRCLFTMIDETGEHSRSHGLTPELLERQSRMMNLPLYTGNASWENYEDEFRKRLKIFRQSGLSHGVFGDIDLEQHRQWVERICNESGFHSHLPLWKENRKDVVKEFIDASFKAVIVVVNTGKMPEEFLGRSIDHKLVGELEDLGIDACGENGEFHSFVYDGPLFEYPVNFSIRSTIRMDGYSYLEID